MSASSIPPPPQVRRHLFDGRYGQMHARVVRPTQEQYRPLYCIHQSPSSSLVYAPIMEKLGVDRLVAAGDTPGFGESDHPQSPPEVQDYAAAHGEVVDAVGINGAFDVMGYFTGSKIAVELALQRPETVHRIVLFGAVIYSDEELGSEKHLYRKDEYQWDGSHIMGWWNHLVRGAPQPYPIELFQRHFAEILRGGPNSWWGHRAAFNYDLRKKLPLLTQPVLIMQTADAQGEKTLRAMDYLADGQLVSFSHMAQGLFELHSQEVEQSLRGFLDSNQ